MATNKAIVCLLVRGPHLNAADARDISMSLGMSDVPVVTIDLSKRGTAFCQPDDCEVGGIIVAGSPTISTTGLRDMFAHTPIVVIGKAPSGSEPVSDIQYVKDWHEAVQAIDEELVASQTLLGELILPTGFMRADDIEAIPGKARTVAA
jgi:hypothetical protein